MGASSLSPYRTAPDSLDAIRADLDAMLGRIVGLEAEPDGSVEPEAVEALAREGRALYLRRALERAADHAAAMLPALGLPQLDAIDLAIATLDALDAPGEDMEPWLAGFQWPHMPLDGEAEPEHDEDDGTGEPSLGAPERNPLMPGAMWRRRPHDGQVRRTLWGGHGIWMLGACNDAEAEHDGREPEPGYDEPEGDDERCGSEHDGAEHPLGWAANVSQLRLHGDREWAGEVEHTAPERRGRGFVRSGPDDAEDDDREEDGRAPRHGGSAAARESAHV